MSKLQDFNIILHDEGISEEQKEQLFTNFLKKAISNWMKSIELSEEQQQIDRYKEGVCYEK